MPHANARDGTRLYFEDTGAGTPLLFIHEFAGDHRSWEPQVRFFSRYFRCVAYAARGIRLERTQTLAGGASHCNFRFSKLERK